MRIPLVLSLPVSLFRRRSKHGPVERLPALLDVPTSYRYILFLLKVVLCSAAHDFTDLLKDPQEKEMKTQNLLELTEYVSSPAIIDKMDNLTLWAVYDMMSANLFRSLPASATASKTGNAKEVQAGEDPSWPHLQLVYEFLLVFTSHAHVKVVGPVNEAFLQRLLDLFECKDAREREYLKKVLHRLYSKVTRHRVFLRKAFRGIFDGVILETRKKHDGLPELLEVMHSIINGFLLPLKEEHQSFLLESLMPLHKPEWLWMYHEHLCACICEFLKKDPKLAGAVIRGLLHYWPVANNRNEVKVLEELGRVLQATQSGDFQSCMVPLFQQINQSLMHPCTEVVLAALKLWSNERVASLIVQNRCILLPHIFGTIERLSRHHESQRVRGRAQSVRQLFWELDQDLFQEFSKAYYGEMKCDFTFPAVKHDQDFDADLLRKWLKANHDQMQFGFTFPTLNCSEHSGVGLVLKSYSGSDSG